MGVWADSDITEKKTADQIEEDNENDEELMEGI